LGLGDGPKSPIPNPQSPIPNPHKTLIIILNIKLIKNIFYIMFKKINYLFNPKKNNFGKILKKIYIY
jgi:hypothetical protein